MANIKRIIVNGIEFTSCKDASDKLGVHKKTITRWLKSGKAEFQKGHSNNHIPNETFKRDIPNETFKRDIPNETFKRDIPNETVEKIWFDEDLGVDETMWNIQPEKVEQPKRTYSSDEILKLMEGKTPIEWHTYKKEHGIMM